MCSHHSSVGGYLQDGCTGKRGQKKGAEKGGREKGDRKRGQIYFPEKGTDLFSGYGK
jgi:hypothetical protein